MERLKEDIAGSGLVLDTSVIIKWFSLEEDTDKALYLLSLINSGVVDGISAVLGVYEATNVLNYNNKFSAEDIKGAIKDLLNIRMNFVNPIQQLMERAVELARKYEITIYDSSFISLAEYEGHNLITADLKLHRKVKEMGFVKLLSEFVL